MHKESRRRMRRHIGKFLPPEAKLIGDLGSYDVNGSYRILIEPPRKYVGIDIEAGPNVDVVMVSEYIVPLPDNYFDALITGQCFEHVRNPFKLMAEASRIVKPGGMILAVAPNTMGEHRFPLDCWRYMGDGWRALFEESGIEPVYTEYIDVMNATAVDSWGIGRKR